MSNPSDKFKNDPSFSNPGKIKFLCNFRSFKNPEKIETITVEARNLDEAVEKLQREKNVIISIEVLDETEKPNFFGFKLPSGKNLLSKESEITFEAPPKTWQEQFGSTPVKRNVIGFSLFARISAREQISFAIQLASLLQGGIPLLRALQISQRGTRNRYFKSVLETCIKDVSAGFSLSYAIKSFKNVFPTVWHHLIEVGEASGTLPAVLREIAHYQESAARLKGKVISAFFYPSILISFATLAVGFLLLNIIPKFAEMFASMNMQLPLITQIVIGFSNILRHYFLLVLLFIIGLIVGVILAHKTKQGTYLFDLLKLKMPIMGNLMLQVSVVRFGRSLATMLRSGVPILQALELSSKLTMNAVAEESLSKAQEAVKGGRSLSAQLEADGFFPPFMTQLVSVGEETGELDRFLELVCNYYEESIDTFLARLTTLLEPLLLICVGAVIGVIVISMILPVIELSTSPNLG